MSFMNRKNTKEFLNIYREKECLWRKGLTSYSSQSARAQAYEELLRKLQEVESDATISDVKNKIEHCRATFRRALRRVLKAVDKEQMPKPRLWYFPLLTFLYKEEFPYLSSLNLKFEELENETDTETGSLESENETSPSNTVRDPPRSRSYRKTLKALLLMYQQTPSLWKMNHLDYGNKRKRKEKMLPLLEKYREFDRSATVATVKKKLDYCRTAYQREVRKMLKRHELGEQYVPKLWYFHLLTFLHEQGHDDLPQPATAMEVSEEAQNSENDSCIEEWIEDEDGDVPADSTLSPAEILHVEKVEAEDHQELGSESEESIKCSAKPSSFSLKQKYEAERDRFDVAGENIAYKLRALDTEQRIRAEKLISDVLYNAELNSLNRNSSLLVSEEKE